MAMANEMWTKPIAGVPREAGERLLKAAANAAANEQDGKTPPPSPQDAPSPPRGGEARAAYVAK